MKTDFSDAIHHLDNLKTISGAEIGDQYFAWDDLYLGTFRTKLTSLGYESDAAYAKLFQQMNRFDCVAEFIDNPNLQMAEIAGFGIILFDRIVRAEVDKVSFSEVFDIHQDLFECLNYVLTQNQKSQIAKKCALIRHANDPKQKDKALVRRSWDEWQTRPDDYEGKMDFARDMQSHFPRLKSLQVIDRWCRAWERET